MDAVIFYQLRRIAMIKYLIRNQLSLFLISFSFLFVCSAYGEKIEENNFPILNLEDFLSDDPVKNEQFVDKLRESLNDFGFFALINHGISEKQLLETYHVANDFFSLPMDQKRKYEGVKKNRGFKGFNPNRKDKTPDLQEYWHVGREMNDDSPAELPLIQKNVWPKEVEKFRPILLNLYCDAECLSNKLLEACAMSIGERREFFVEKTSHGDSILRVIHYKKDDSENPSGLVWKAAHKDPNVLTLIMGISSEGLEIQRPDGSWLPVPLIEGAIIVSASDMLEHLSNGYFKSTTHRVLNKVNYSRYSIPFFVHLNRDGILKPSDKAIEKTGGDCLYPTLTVGEALQSHNWFELKSIEKTG